MTMRHRRGRHIVCRPLVVATTVLACACTSPTSDAARSMSRTTIVFTNDSRTASARPAGPFVSVLDSIDLVITSSSNAIVAHKGQRLHGYDSTAALSVDLPSGTNTFAAQVLSSSTGAAIFSGQTSHTGSADRDTIVIPLVAAQPALLVTLDTTRTTIVTSSQFTIYNAGTGTLVWNVSGTDTAFARCGGECLISPQNGQLGAGQSAIMRVAVPTNFPSRLFSFVLHSTQGDVTARWQYGASPIGGVIVQPTPSLLTVGQAVTLTATVQSGNASSAVTWSSSNSSVATVSSAGRVQGGAAGSATIAATSVVDTTRKGFADVRVYTTSDSLLWSIPQPEGRTAVARDVANAVAPLTVQIDAQLFFGRINVTNPFAFVEFWARPAAGGTWIRIAQTAAPTLVIGKASTTWTWSVTWNPSAADAPFPNPSTTPMAIIAVGVRPDGVPIATPVNTSVTVTVP